jgi:hypothetical protein
VEGSSYPLASAREGQMPKPGYSHRYWITA